MNIMTVVILALLVLNAVWGYRRGLVGKMSGLIALCISSVIVSAILPTVTGILKEQTPVYGWITQQCMTTVSSMAAKAVSSQAVEDAKNSAGSRCRAGLVHSLFFMADAPFCFIIRTPPAFFDILLHSLQGGEKGGDHRKLTGEQKNAHQH